MRRRHSRPMGLAVHVARSATALGMMGGVREGMADLVATMKAASLVRPLWGWSKKALYGQA